MRKCSSAARLIGTMLAACIISGCTKTGPIPLGDGSPSFKTAQAALASGVPDLALQVCDRLLRASPRSPDVLVCKGNALSGLGRNVEATTSFSSALNVMPNFPDALIGLGRLRLTTDPVLAEQMFMNALKQQPRNPIALNDLGIARDLQGRHTDAQTAYAEAVAAAPDSRAPQVNLALSLALSGRASEASRMLQPFADQPNASARERHDYAAALAMSGHSDQATQYLRPELSGVQLDSALTGFRAMPLATP